ncbi:hypothetical protein C0Q70_12638 [Pomacea canaliculata]|uniref:Uncharacterized protein n=1 Tax=Pomacea canaliculata TaxID=400727 RepID=A0A2T7P224_POMCA|nr:hypothetical protein C0Q70_12638 [Pomacea canaliculata]
MILAGHFSSACRLTTTLVSQYIVLSPPPEAHFTHLCSQEHYTTLIHLQDLRLLPVETETSQGSWTEDCMLTRLSAVTLEVTAITLSDDSNHTVSSPCRHNSSSTLSLLAVDH